MRRFLILLALIILALAGAVIYVLNPRLPTPSGEQSAQLYAAGQLGMATEAIRLVDPSRPTPPNGEFLGTPDRRLDGRIWYPANAAEAPYPLIIYSHGYMSSVVEALYLVEFLVPKGYVVAAVNYPLSSGGAPGSPIVQDVINQPGDLSYLIDNLLARNADPADPLHGLLDPNRIAAVGLSLGGLTTQLAAYHRDLRDPRLRAAVSIAGPSAMLDAEFFTSTQLPFMMLAGSEDAVVPYAANAAPMLDKVANGLLVTLAQGSHTGFASAASVYFRWARHPDRIVCRLLLDTVGQGEPAQRRPMLAADATAGISGRTEPACTMREFERAMRPAKQQMLTRLAIYAFLEGQFALDAGSRYRMQGYLEEVFPLENPEVDVQTSHISGSIAY